MNSPPAVAGSPARRLLLVAALLIAAHAVIAWSARPPGIVTRQDDALYVLLSRSLADGHYADISRVDQAAHRQYPLVYPAMLAVWYGVLGEGHDRGVVLSIICSIVMLGAVFLMVRRLLSPLVAVLTVAVLAVNPFVVSYSGSIASEIPFAMFFFLALACVSLPEVTPVRAALAGGTAIVAALTRLAGLPLLAALGFHWLLDRQWRRTVLFGLACALAVGLWLWWSSASPELYAGSSYVADLQAPGLWDAGVPTIVARLYSRVSRYTAELGPYALAVPTIRGTLIDNVIGVLITSLGLIVGIVVVWKRWRIAALALIGYALLLIIYTWEEDRFLTPMLPLIVPTLLAGFLWTGRRWGETAGRMAVVVPALVLVASGAARTAGEVRASVGCDRSERLPDDACIRLDQRSFFAAVRWIEANLPPDAVFMTMKPEPMYYYTGRMSVSARRALAEPGETFMQHLRAAGATHVLLGSTQAAEVGTLSDRLLGSCAQLELLAFFPARTYLFRIRAADEEDVGGEACEAVRAHARANVGRDFERDP